MSTHLIRIAGTVTAGAFAAALVGALAAPASAAPLDPTPEDYTQSIQLSWDGTGYADSTTENFLGTPVAIPGDTATRTLLVRNDGPTDGTLRATITDVDLLDPDALDVQHHPGHRAPDDSGLYTGAGDQGDFYDDLQLDWAHGQASFTQLAADEQTVITQVPLAAGEQVPVTLTYELPPEATSGNQANVAERLASLTVVLELGGEFPTPATPDPSDPTPTPDRTEPTAEPTPAPTAAPTAPAEAADAPPTTQTQSSAMPQTGADLRWPALAVAALLALGALLLRASRRREDVRGHH